MKLMFKLGLVCAVWVALVFGQNIVDQIVENYPAVDVMGTKWTCYDYANPLTRSTTESDVTALTMQFGTFIFWSVDVGNNFPQPPPVAGDMLGVIGSFDPEYEASPSTYGDNEDHKGYYWLYSEELVSGTENHWMTDTCRPLPKPSAVQAKGPEDSVSVSIQNPAETRYSGQTSYDVLGYDLWVDTTGTGTPNAYANGIHLGFYPVNGGAGNYTYCKWWPADYFPDKTKTCYHAYYLVAAPGFTTTEGHMTSYLSENADPVDIVGIAEQKDAVPIRMSLNAAPSITRVRSTISYALTKTTAVSITIYDVSGQVVRTLVDGVQAAGEHTVMFDGTDMPSGVYFCQLMTPDAQLNTKLTVLR